MHYRECAEEGGCALALVCMCVLGGLTVGRGWGSGGLSVGRGWGSVRRSVCAGLCGAAKLATCLSLVVVLVFPFIRPRAAMLPLGAVSLLPRTCVYVCVCTSVCVCTAQVPVGLERLMFLKVRFTLSSAFSPPPSLSISLFFMFY